MQSTERKGVHIWQKFNEWDALLYYSPWIKLQIDFIENSNYKIYKNRNTKWHLYRWSGNIEDSTDYKDSTSGINSRTLDIMYTATVMSVRKLLLWFYHQSMDMTDAVDRCDVCWIFEFYTWCKRPIFDISLNGTERVDRD